jgi:hypothetical protein
VYVAFFCLSQVPTATSSESIAQEQEGGPSNVSKVPISLLVEGADEATMLQNLKKRDEELIRIISDSRKVLAERGIKLTVVLLTTRDMLGEWSMWIASAITC